MDQPVDQIEEEKQNLAFSLQDITVATVVFINVSSLQREKEMLQWFKETFTTHKHFILDVASEKIDSLYNRLQLFQTTNTISPLDFVHVIGLENSFSRIENNQSIPSPLIPVLNYDRELFFKLPFHTVLWGDKLFFQTLNRLAPDFTHWVTKWFEFCENEPEIDLPEIPRPRARGKIPTRSAYIDQLEQKYQALNLNTSDQRRLTRDKITLLTTLGDEYKKQSEFDKAISKYQLALKLAESINDLFEQVKIKFNLGSCFYISRYPENAFIYFSASLALSQRLNDELYISRNYHGLAVVYKQQQKWELALSNFNFAIESSKRMGSKNGLPATYRLIGNVYSAQQKWADALLNYQFAIENNDKSTEENIKVLSSTYQDIGYDYYEQGNWVDALHYFNLAIENCKQGSDQHDLGSSYAGIGLVYGEQEKWTYAFKYFNLAIESHKNSGNEQGLGQAYYAMAYAYQRLQKWEKATNYLLLAKEILIKINNEYDLGDIFQQLGEIYEELDDYKESAKYYQLAVEKLNKYKQPYSVPKENLGRVLAKLAELENTPTKLV